MSDPFNPTAGEAATDALIALGKIKLPPEPSNAFCKAIGATVYIGVTMDSLYTENARLRAALDFYGEKAEAVRRNFRNPEALSAIVVELFNDNGQRAKSVCLPPASQPDRSGERT